MHNTDRLEFAKRITGFGTPETVLYSNDSYEIYNFFNMGLYVFAREYYNNQNEPLGFKTNPSQIIDLISSGKEFKEYVDDNGLNANNTEFYFFNQNFTDDIGEKWLKSKKKGLFSKPVQFIDPVVIENLRNEIENCAPRGRGR